jgi:hypothetical protein
MRIKNRIAPALATAAVLAVTISGMVSAHSGASLLTAGAFSSYYTGPALTSKTIDTEAGSCTGSGGTPCTAAAVYGANGFTGTLHFSGSGTATAWDYICVHTPAASSFKTFAGTFTFSLYNGTTLLGSATYAIAGGSSCTGSTNYAGSHAGITFTVPASGIVNYTISIAGITSGSSAQAAFSSFNSIRNEAFDSRCNVARSYSVPPPTNFIIPEAPFAVLLPLSAGLLAAAFVMRKPRNAKLAA